MGEAGPAGPGGGASYPPSLRAFLGKLSKVHRGIRVLLLVLLAARLHEIGVGGHFAPGLVGVAFAHGGGGSPCRGGGEGRDGQKNKYGGRGEGGAGNNGRYGPNQASLPSPLPPRPPLISLQSPLITGGPSSAFPPEHLIPPINCASFPPVSFPHPHSPPVPLF